MDFTHSAGQDGAAEEAKNVLPAARERKLPRTTRRAGHVGNAEEARLTLPAPLASNGEEPFARAPGQDDDAEQANFFMPTPVQSILALAPHYRATQKSRIAEQQHCESFLLQLRGGYSPNQPEAQRKKIWAEIRRVRLAVEKSANTKAPAKSGARAGQFGTAEEASMSLPARKLSGKGTRRDSHEHYAEEAIATLPSRLPPWADVPYILISARHRAEWEAREQLIVEQMEAFAAKLPAFEWWSNIRGCAAKGLALIIAEAGDLTPNGLDVNGRPLGYTDKSKLWKRMGLAVIDGERQQKIKGDAEKALRHGYNPPRHSVAWQVGDSLFRAQWAGDRDEDGKPCRVTEKPMVTPAHALGPYGELYARRRAATADREWSKKHQHNDAVRYMTKKLLSHLLAEWKSFA